MSPYLVQKLWTSTIQVLMNNSFNIEFLIGGLAAGLAVGALCLSTCSCLLLPIFLSQKQNFKKSFFTFLYFSAGRLIAYVVFGAMAGWIGSQFSSFFWFNWVIAAGYLVVALLLLSYINKNSYSCNLELKSKKSTIPFFLGITTGLNFCPPFVLAATVAIKTQNPFWGSAYFFTFFLGTSVYLFPLIFASALTRWNFWRKIGKLAGTVVAFVYIFISLSTFHSLLNPETSVNLEKMVSSDCKNLKLIDTRELDLGTIGYAGKTPLGLLISDSGIISNIFLLENQESDYVTKPVSTWLKQWHKTSANYLYENVKKVDGITGATLTIDALRENLHAASHNYLSVGNPAVSRVSITETRFIKNYFPFVILFIIAILVMKIPRFQKSWLRWCLWIFSVLILGFYRSTFFSIENVSLLLRGSIPPLINISWYVVFLITIISPLFFGKVYCKYVCPFGALSEICYRIVPLNLQLSPSLAKKLVYVKYILLFLIVVGTVLFSKIPVEKFEPFHAIFTKNQPRTYFIFGVSVLIVSCFIKRFWCSFFCVDAALFEIINIAQKPKDRRAVKCL